MGDFDRFARKLDDFADDIGDSVDDTIEEQLDLMVEDARVALSANDTNWRGTLYFSFDTRREIRQDGNSKHVLENTAPHAGFAEFGTGVFFNNTDPQRDVERYEAPSFSKRLQENIEEWVETKPIVPRHYDSTRSLSWAIADTISELGTKSQPFIRPAYNYRKPLLVDAVKRSIRKEMHRL